jgi:hypothetical protein
VTSIFVDLGAEPWRPSPSSEELLRLDFYNIPLAGILVEKTINDCHTLYLYLCAAGEEDDTNVWFYAPITEAERQRLSEATPDQLVQAMADSIKNRMLVAALAQDWRVVSVEKVDAGEENPGLVVNRVLKRLVGQYEHTTKNLVELLDESESSSARQLASA